MKRDLLAEEKKRGDLIRNHLGRMVVAVIHKRRYAVRDGIGETELCRAYGVGLKSDAEDLGLEGNVYLRLIVRGSEHLVKRLLESCSRAYSVGGNILISIGDPYVENRGNARLLGEILGDLEASDSMSYPECTNLLVGRGKSEIILYHRMREEGGVEVDAHSARLCELYPLCKVLWLYCVAICPLTVLKYCVAGVKIQLLLTGYEREHLVHICRELLEASSLAGIVTGDLNAAGKRRRAIKANYVVTLPAMDGDCGILQRLDSALCIYAILCVGELCGFIVFHISSPFLFICTLRFPIAVASIGRATTLLLVYSSVNVLR